MPSPSRSSRTPSRWWQRRTPSITVLVGLLAVMGLASAVLATNVLGVVDEVGKDAQGIDPWEDPVGIERAGEFQIIRIPDCAAAPIVRVTLWDEDSNPYWEVTGPPSPFTTLVVGVAPEGFTELTPYRQPPPGAVLRVAVVRVLRGVAGVRYRSSDLRTGFVASGLPISRSSVERFQTAAVCGDGEATEDTTTTTVPG